MEGGPKGLDIDRSGNVVAITCEEQALAFFALAALTGDPGQSQDVCQDKISASEAL